MIFPIEHYLQAAEAEMNRDDELICSIMLNLWQILLAVYNINISTIFICVACGLHDDMNIDRCNAPVRIFQNVNRIHFDSLTWLFLFIF